MKFLPLLKSALIALVLLPTLVQAAPPVLITTQLPSAPFKQPYETRLAINASPQLSEVTFAGLPSGLTASYDSIGNVTISGAPTVAGKATVTINARNADGAAQFQIELSVFKNRVDSVAAGGLQTCAVLAGGVQC